MGRKSRDAGKEFEQRVENALRAASQSRLVTWWAHQQPAVTRAGKPIGQSGADFALVLRGGLSGAIECKSVLGDRLARHVIRPEQARHLDTVARSGGLALLAVEFRDVSAGIVSAHLVPWLSVPWTVARSAESATRDALAEWRMRPDGSIAALTRVCPACDSVGPIGPISGCCHGGPPF